MLTPDQRTELGLVLIGLALIAVLLFDAAEQQVTGVPLPVCTMPEDLDR